MSTRHVILGLLREQPAHPYDVAVRFGRRLDPWQMNRGQVYRTVSTLEKEGLIEKSHAPDENSRSGPPMRLTDAGEYELDRWFATRSEDVEPLRSELLAKLAVVEPRHASELLFAIDWYERSLIAQLEKDIHQRQANPVGDGWAEQVVDCIADAAILNRDAELTWVRRVRETIRGWAAQPGEVDREAGLRSARNF